MINMYKVNMYMYVYVYTYHKYDMYKVIMYEVHRSKKYDGQKTFRKRT